LISGIDVDAKLANYRAAAQHQGKRGKTSKLRLESTLPADDARSELGANSPSSPNEDCTVADEIAVDSRSAGCWRGSRLEPAGRQTDRPACLFHQSAHSVFRDDDGSGAVGDNIIAIGREANGEHAHTCRRLYASCS